jgi:hypothetical protein
MDPELIYICGCVATIGVLVAFTPISLLSLWGAFAVIVPAWLMTLIFSGIFFSECYRGSCGNGPAIAGTLGDLLTIATVCITLALLLRRWRRGTE